MAKVKVRDDLEALGVSAKRARGGEEGEALFTQSETPVFLLPSSLPAP